MEIRRGTQVMSKGHDRKAFSTKEDQEPKTDSGEKMSGWNKKHSCLCRKSVLWKLGGKMLIWDLRP